jgi:hypothetical protein
MAANVLEIVNAALSKLGSEPISSLSGTSKTAISCKARFGPCKNHVLRQHPWNCAIKRTSVAVYDTIRTGSENFTRYNNVWRHNSDANITVSYNGTQWVYNDPGFGDFSTVTSSNSSFPPETGWSNGYTFAYTNYTVPDHEYSYAIAMPSDCVRILSVNGEHDDFEIEGRTILTNEMLLELRYVSSVGTSANDIDGTYTGVSVLDSSLVEAIASYLAWDICYKITQSSQLKQELLEDYKIQLSKAKLADGQEGPTQQIEADGYLEARLSGTSPEPKRNW